MTTDPRAHLEQLIAQWRANARQAQDWANDADAKFDQSGNAHAFLKERRIWTTCADELAEALALVLGPVQPQVVEHTEDPDARR